MTGKELDTETGLYYYGARYYDSRISRFISLDPAGINLADIRSFTNPQGWNMYSYALNNPVKYTDPSGKYAETALMAPLVTFSVLKFIEVMANIAVGVAVITNNISDNIYVNTPPQINSKPEALIPPAVDMPNHTTLPAETQTKPNIVVNPATTENGNQLMVHPEYTCPNPQGLMTSGDGRVINPTKQDSKIWGSLNNYRDGIKTNGLKGKNKEFYKWDNLHNEIEVFNREGIHKGVMDPSSGTVDSSARVNGREIKKEIN
ncbi:MAG: RHS repeat-associated core domain-containing protein [Candidatus Gracilibacteria bacterium]